ncbi:hypothetical protein [Streptacidiphilus jiangxiensis]|uniref:PknH-like extracellular domain-containing protein n=1 Tax=Streptacidiphilus jiangxiensis TaxID=235985 RepID=A0A1H7J1C2_STRJI|nr:hypothetical protein [Streptacidiphilus jiangxiensis]SEK68571.1 hypothetical protein SAMN05414137_103111 [Streptacidiphilus jiangxiensis]
MRALRSSRAAKFAAVAAVALGLAAGATGTANAAGHTSPWLTGAQMPQTSAFHWQAEPKTRYTTTGEFQWLYTCGAADPTHELHSSSVSVEQYGTKARHVQGSEVLFHFSSAAKAKAALKRIEFDYATCVGRLDHGAVDMQTGKPVHARVDRTAWIQDGVSYRVEIRNKLGRPAELPDLPSDAQEFFVQRGNTVSFVTVEGTNPHLDVTAGSLNVLKTMAARLG